MKSAWTPDSWRLKAARQQPPYRDPQAVSETCARLSGMPGLVQPGEVNALRSEIAEAALGRRFILHGGDCVERFQDLSSERILNQLRIILQMSLIITHAARRPVLRIARMAGQYFKPRSEDLETLPGGRSVPVYRGDGVNGFAAGDREPDPDRLLEAYRASAVTLNFMRSVIAGGFADLHHPYSWNLHHIEQTPRWPEYRDILDRILDSVHFMESVGGINPRQIGEVRLFTSHEGLVLPYEESMLRRDPESGRQYLLSAHMPWIGDRTRGLEEAHVEFFRGVANPIGIKLGPGIRAEELPPLLERLDPDREPGRITLITRFGAEHNRDLLPTCIRRVSSTGHEVAWSCDPMHGNTRSVGPDRIKTRRFDAVMDELDSAMQIHQSEGTVLAGLHFEMTGEDVTECIGGPQDLTEQDLSRNYESFCDPRLNYAQSMEVAFLVANRLKGSPANRRTAVAPNG